MPTKTKRQQRYCMPDPLALLTDEIIMAQIAPGSRVIDLGCGDGRLLQSLRDRHGSEVLGVERDRREIVAAAARGVPVIQADLDSGLSDVPDHSFDFAVLSQTLQQVRRARFLLDEMLRVARQALVVVPNFGHWRVRWQVARNGRVPVTSEFPYEWYQTPNLNFMSMKDFRDLAEQAGLTIVREVPIINGRAVDQAWWANLRANSAFYVLERKAG